MRKCTLKNENVIFAEDIRVITYGKAGLISPAPNPALGGSGRPET